MPKPNEDTIDTTASTETTADDTQVGSQEGTDDSTDSGAKAQPKVYAGKFKSTEELETAYKNAESKIGQKTYAETLGQRVVESTGYSIRELEEAGYTPDQIVQAVIASKTGTEEVTLPPEPKHNPFEAIKKTVEETKVERLEWKMEVKDFVLENPEAKEFLEDINEFHSMPQYRGMSPADIFNNKLKKFVQKSEQVVQAKQSEKERASISINHNPAPVSKPAADAQKKFYKTGHFDDAVDYVSKWLTRGRN